MKSHLAKALLIAAAAALLAVSVEAQQGLRSKKKSVLQDQAFGLGFGTSNLGGGTTGGNGGVIIGPAPNALSPITVNVPLP